LATIKADASLEDIALVRRSRLSVVPITSKEFRRVAKLGETRVPRDERPRKRQTTRKS
jgi:predicted RNA-binding protein with PUA-like domain